jgi:hypothetical protein
MLLSFPGSQEQRTLFNKCTYALNAALLPLDTDAATRKRLPPLLIIIDPRTAAGALRTIQALRHVQDIEKTELHIFLDDCGPTDALWDARTQQACAHGVASDIVQQLVALDFMRVELRAVVPSDSMLVTVPVKSTRWSARLWLLQHAASPEYLKIRVMHAMREVLIHDSPPRLQGAPRHSRQNEFVTKGRLSLVLNLLALLVQKYNY